MWKEPYSYHEGFVIAFGLILVGAMLQLSMGALYWDIFMWPANLITLILFILFSVLAYARRK